MKTLLLIIELSLSVFCYGQKFKIIEPDSSYVTHSLGYNDPKTHEVVYEFQYSKKYPDGKLVIPKDTMRAFLYMYNMYEKALFREGEEGSKYYQLLKDFERQVKTLNYLHEQMKNNYSSQIRILTEQNRLLTNRVKQLSK